MLDVQYTPISIIQALAPRALQVSLDNIDVLLFCGRLAVDLSDMSVCELNRRKPLAETASHGEARITWEEKATADNLTQRPIASSRLLCFAHRFIT